MQHFQFYSSILPCSGVLHTLSLLLSVEESFDMKLHSSELPFADDDDEESVIEKGVPTRT